MSQSAQGQQHDLDTSPHISDDIRQTTCYMCACRCGINVHLRNDEKGGEPKIRYIEGNRDHPVNLGVLCAKGSAGIMQHYSPARLQNPLKRVGPRGSGEFKEITWDEALSEATDWLQAVRETDPKKLAFFTGRDQSQSLTSWWAQQFGTPNYAAHGGFCSVNMAAAGIYTMGGAFWEFGSPDWERTELFMIFGVAEDHDSNPIKLGLSKLKERGVKTISVNPIRTGYNAIADEWVSITPGTDGLFILSLVHELLKSGHVDLNYLIRYTNVPWLVNDDESSDQYGLIIRDKDNNPLIWDREKKKAVSAMEKNLRPALNERIKLKDGILAIPVFLKLAEKYLSDDYAPEKIAPQCGIEPEQIRSIAKELAQAAFEKEIIIDQPWTDFKGEKHKTMIGRPVSFHAMRGISAHSNGFQTCRAIHLLQILLGSVEVPGGFRFKPPYPKPMEAHPAPHTGHAPSTPLDGPHLGYVRGPEGLQIDKDGNPIRIDKAYSWEAPMAAHGLMHMVISNAASGDPYPIDVLFLYMANMAWNSSMNTSETIGMLTATHEDGSYKIPKIIYADAYSSEMVAYADLILPDTTYLERHDCISLLDRPICEPDTAADAIRWPVLEPNREVRGFQSALIDLGSRLGLPGFVDENGNVIYKDYADYMVNHQRRPGVGPLAGFRGKDGKLCGRGEPNPDQLQAYINNGGFWSEEIPEEARFFKPWNQAYQDWAVKMSFFDKPQPYIFQVYLEPLAKFQLCAKGKAAPEPPEHLKEQVLNCFDPLPHWYPPFEGSQLDLDHYPYHALTQRPAAMYHSWGSQNAWLRQIHGSNVLYVPGTICDDLNLKDNDWVEVSSTHASITVPMRRMDAVNGKTMWTWNAIGKKKGAWSLDLKADESETGFLLNHLIHELLPQQKNGQRWMNSDPITGQAAWFDLRVNIKKADNLSGKSLPSFAPHKSPVSKPEGEIKYGKEWS